MIRLAVIAAVLPTLAAAQERLPCSFVVGHATLSAESRAQPESNKPDWFIVSGRAELTVSGRKLEARFYDSRLGGELSHTLRGTIQSPSTGAKRKPVRVAAILRTMGTDSGDDALSGTYLVTIEKQGNTAQSLVVHNPGSFVGVTCYAKSAT